jgi:hypothetical protein
MRRSRFSILIDVAMAIVLALVFVFLCLLVAATAQTDIVAHPPAALYPRARFGSVADFLVGQRAASAFF